MKRVARIERKTKETDISAQLSLDENGNSDINTGIKFFDHMLELMSAHGLFNLEIKAKGDLEVDTHHTVEDIGIAMGKAFNKSLGDKSGIKRYSTMFTPMDEAMTMVSLDISGRGYLHFDVPLNREYVGDFEVETLEEFMRAFSLNGGITLHIKLIYGKNNHHIIESIFKGLGRAIKEAVELDKRISGIMSTKGVI